MTPSTFHIVFSLSAAVSLREALAAAGRSDKVVGLSDNLSFGPIDPSAGNVRAAWVELEFGDAWADVTAASDAFWWAVIGHSGRRVLWTSRRSAGDFAGFLDCLWRLGESECHVIDLAEPLALIPAAVIARDRLWELAMPLSGEKRQEYHAIWARLRAEDAALRVLDADLSLVSAPISFFDDQLLAAVPIEWRKAARVIGTVLAGQMDDGLYQCGDLVLASRLRALVRSGKLEIRGDVTTLQSYEVRSPPHKPPP